MVQPEASFQNSNRNILSSCLKPFHIPLKSKSTHEQDLPDPVSFSYSSHLDFFCSLSPQGPCTWHSFFFFFFFLKEPNVWHIEVPRLEIESELQLPATATATATATAGSKPRLWPTPQLSQRQILNPLSQGRDRTRILMVPSRTGFHCTMTGNPKKLFLKKKVNIHLPAIPCHSIILLLDIFHSSFIHNSQKTKQKQKTTKKNPWNNTLHNRWINKMWNT